MLHSTHNHNYDLVWKNSAYTYVCAHEILQLLRLNYDNLFKHSVCINETFANSTANNWDSNTIYRTCIAYTEGEITEVI